jgi:hypothetical protein
MAVISSSRLCSMSPASHHLDEWQDQDLDLIEPAAVHHSADG